MAIGFVKPEEKPPAPYVRQRPDPPRPGDVVEGTHPEGRVIIGRVERVDGPSLAVRDDAGFLWDFYGAHDLRVVERWTGRIVEYLGVRYAPTIEHPSRLGRLRSGVRVTL